eukprot:764266-Hanusia_phi.AAC.1
MAEGAIESVCHSQISSAKLGRPGGKSAGPSGPGRRTRENLREVEVGNHPQLGVEAEVYRPEGRKLDALKAFQLSSSLPQAPDMFHRRGCFCQRPLARLGASLSVLLLFRSWTSSRKQGCYRLDRDEEDRAAPARLSRTMYPR